MADRIIRAQSVKGALNEKFNALDILARLCYYFPQYKLSEARALPFKHVCTLLKTANKEKARDYINLVQISAAPHTKKGAGVKKLVSEYKKVING